jgi:hypothetical protein
MDQIGGDTKKLSIAGLAELEAYLRHPYVCKHRSFYVESRLRTSACVVDLSPQLEYNHSTIPGPEQRQIAIAQYHSTKWSR